MAFFEATRTASGFYGFGKITKKSPNALASVWVETIRALNCLEAMPQSQLFSQIFYHQQNYFKMEKHQTFRLGKAIIFFSAFFAAMALVFVACQRDFNAAPLENADKPLTAKVEAAKKWFEAQQEIEGPTVQLMKPQWNKAFSVHNAVEVPFSFVVWCRPVCKRKSSFVVQRRPLCKFKSTTLL